ncbi:MAG: U3 snoRNA-associated protein 15, UTP15 [Amphiamblys sp. WSBS2006]|nr:MAG: U3 snoRNA-associated protein 15, UTP15 [Amphiamblys sp. WSBS2006]
MGRYKTIRETERRTTARSTGPLEKHTRRMMDEKKSVRTVSFTQDGAGDFVSCTDNSVRIHRRAGGYTKRVIQQFKEKITACDIRRDGRLVSTGHEDGTLRVCAVDERKCLRKTETGSAITGCLFGEREVAASSKDGKINLVDITTGECRGRLGGHRGEVLSVCRVGQDGSVMASSGADRTVRVWDVRAGIETHRTERRDSLARINTCGALGYMVGCSGTAVCLWDRRKEGVVYEKDTFVPIGDVSGMEGYFVTASADRRARLYSTASCETAKLVSLRSRPLSVDATPDAICFGMRHMTGIVFESGKERREAAKETETQDVLYVQTGARETLGQTDAFIKSFEYHRALDTVFRRKKDTGRVFLVVAELSRLGVLRKAVEKMHAVAEAVSFLKEKSSNWSSPVWEDLCGAVLARIERDKRGEDLATLGAAVDSRLANSKESSLLKAGLKMFLCLAGAE